MSKKHEGMTWFVPTPEHNVEEGGWWVDSYYFLTPEAQRLLLSIINVGLFLHQFILNEAKKLAYKKWVEERGALHPSLDDRRPIRIIDEDIMNEVLDKVAENPEFVKNLVEYIRDPDGFYPEVPRINPDIIPSVDEWLDELFPGEDEPFTREVVEIKTRRIERPMGKKPGKA